ncbi:hypothetical protein LPJ70_002142 [Coemansia sp. RSA 2708]|nr:hypothetical protein LPJ70_002142 [Coemansia sp. RSA 2708]
MSALQLVSDCSAQRYCTANDQALAYGNQFVLQWNNQYPPLNAESMVTVSVYSAYDLTRPVFSQTGVSNVNGRIALTPDPTWFSRYSGSNDAAGRQQQIYFAVYLQGNDPPAASSMLPLQLTATPAQYAEILQVLHPSPSSSAPTASPASSAASSEPSAVSATATTSSLTTLREKPTASGSLEPTSSQSDDLAAARSGLSGGAIAGIAVGSAAGLLLLPMRRRRQRRKRMLANPPPPLSTASSASSHPGGGSDAAVAATAAAALAAGEKLRPASDTPLLLNSHSFASRDASLADSQLSPKTAVYQPLSLDAPRVLMSMPAASTRSVPSQPDAILTSDAARQIGDVFRDALRRPPPVSEDGTADDPHRDTMLMHLDDELEEDEDPGWRERVASERMQRELEQEASVIRSVAMRAHGSDYSSSRPPTSQSDTSHHQS